MRTLRFYSCPYEDGKGDSLKFTILFLLIPLWVHAAGDPVSGKTKSRACIACHGEAGVSVNEIWPNLAGQKENYLVRQLGQFRTGVRVDPLMSPVARSLSEADIADIAAYFASLKP